MAALPNRDDIRAVAQDVLQDLLGPGAGRPGAAAERGGRSPGRRLISQAEVRAAREAGEGRLVVPSDAIVTPLAHDLAWDLKVEIVYQGAGSAPAAAPDGGGPAPRDERSPIALGADHGGFRLKQAIARHLKGAGHTVLDLGTHTEDACDYPDLAAAVARAVALGEAGWGVLVDGAGIGSCMAANKVPGVLAATCHDERTAKNSREHNGANVLCLGSGTLDEPSALRVVDAWLAAATGGGRHARRVAKIRAIERSFVR